MHVKVTNGTIDQYPYTVGQLRRDNPQTSFPKRIPDEMLAEWGVVPVVVEDHPTIDARTQTAAQDAMPTDVNGSFTLKWTVSQKSDAEIAEYDAGQAAQVRSKRDRLIAETDYLALSDTTLTAEMAAYRQALRDITDHASFPYLADTDWPVKP